MCPHLLFFFSSPLLVCLYWVFQGCPVKISCQHLSLCDAKPIPLALWLPVITGKDICIHMCVFWVCTSVTEVLWCLDRSLIPVCVVYSCFSAVFRRSVWLKVLSSCSGIEVWPSELSLPVKPSPSLPPPSNKSSDAISKRNADQVPHPQTSLWKTAGAFLQLQQWGACCKDGFSVNTEKVGMLYDQLERILFVLFSFLEEYLMT